MKQLTCELCESTDFVKQDGFFICQGCGTKYSLAEAKQLMMGDSAPASDAPAAPKPGNSAVVENYLTMAESALDANNNAEAETYSNKVLELDPTNAKAWEIKGKAAGWQSKTNNSRLGEAMNAFMMAVEYASDEDKADMRVRVGNGFRALGNAMLNLHCENFGEIPDEDHAQKITKCLDDVIGMMNDLVAKSCVGFNRGTFYNDLARTMNNCACDGFKEAQDDFGPEHRNMAKWQWERYTGRCDACLLVLEKALPLAREASLAKQICDNYKTIGESARDSCSWKFNVNSWNSDNYDRDYSFTDGAKKIRTDAINNFTKKKSAYNVEQHAEVMKLMSGAREASEIAAAREKYWEEHAAEKEQLLARKEEIAAELDGLQKELAKLDSQRQWLNGQLNAAVPAMEEKADLQRRVGQMERDLRAMGLFKFAEKKALRAQIDDLLATMPQIDDRIRQETEAQNAPIYAQIDELDAQIRPLSSKRQALQTETGDIQNELTKSRGKLDTAGMFELPGAVKDGKFAVTYTEFLEHLERITPAPYQYGIAKEETTRLSSHCAGCRMSIVTDPTLSGDNKNTGTTVYFELEPGTDNIRKILLTGPYDHSASQMRAWCVVGTMILMSLSPETKRETAEEIFADLAFSYESTWYGEHGISVEYADHVLIEVGRFTMRNSCAVIRPDC